MASLSRTGEFPAVSGKKGFLKIGEQEFEIKSWSMSYRYPDHDIATAQVVFDCYILKSQHRDLQPCSLCGGDVGVNSDARFQCVDCGYTYMEKG